MHLIQILLPLYDNRGQRIDAATHAEVQRELAERFGGLTSYLRAPAEGVWKETDDEVHDSRTHHDEIVIYEVMTKDIDESWWKTYRQELEIRFRQWEVVIRDQTIRLL